MNVELAERAIRVAKENPEQFDMDSWVSGLTETLTKGSEDFVPPCGTTACYAGWVSFLAAPVGSKVIGSSVKLPGTRTSVHVEPYAREALGITQAQGDILFYAGDIEEVERVVNYLADNPDADEISLARVIREGRS